MTVLHAQMMKEPSLRLSKCQTNLFVGTCNKQDPRILAGYMYKDMSISEIKMQDKRPKRNVYLTSDLNIFEDKVITDLTTSNSSITPASCPHDSMLK